MAQLNQMVEKIGGIDEVMLDCGEKLSVGEAQLMCLARYGCRQETVSDYNLNLGKYIIPFLQGSAAGCQYYHFG